MTMTPRLRKFALTAHVTSSVGWLGAIVAFLALAVVVLTSQDTQMVRAAYPAAEPTAWLVIVPLSLGSLLTGLVPPCWRVRGHGPGGVQAAGRAPLRAA